MRGPTAKDILLKGDKAGSKRPGRAENGAIAAPKPPRLPSGLHPAAKRWWRDLWASPMAGLLDDLDREGLVATAMLLSDFHRSESAMERTKIITAFRLAVESHGLRGRGRPRMEPAADWASRRRERLKPSENNLSGLLKGGRTND